MISIQLLAVDDPRLLQALQPTFVRRAGWRVLTANDADEMLVKARSVRPDLVLLDADGWGGEGCRLLKLDADIAETPVILLASDPRPAAGADAVVSKPVARSALLAAIRRFVVVPERASPRRRVSRPATFFQGGHERTGSTKDLSPGGAFLRCAAPPEAGESVHVIFDLPTDGAPTIRATARVVRVVRSGPDSHLIPGAGLRWLEMSARDRAELAAFVGEGES